MEDSPERRADDSRTPMAGPSWGGIAVYYAVALSIAAPFNLGLAAGWLRDTFPGTLLAEWTFLPAALGPALGALIARRLDARAPLRTTVLGVDRRQALLIAFLPVAAFALLGRAGWLLPIAALLYALGEELGWRGYLADATHSLSRGARHAFTALLWWPWHLRFETTFDWVGLPLIVLASCWLLGHAAWESRSVLVAAAMHATVILLSASGTPGRPLLIAGGVTLGGWILIGKLFPSRASSGK